MAEGRMLNRAISQSKKMAKLSDDTSRLLFTWMIPHLDAEGRMKGDPSLFRAAVCPRLDHITTQQVEKYLKEWDKAEAILWYDADGDKYIYCIGWDRQQRNLRKEREAPSRYPEPPPDLLRSKSGVAPRSMPQKLINVNEINSKGVNLENGLMTEVLSKIKRGKK